VTGGAHDTLRDEFAATLYDYLEEESAGYVADRLLPVVRRYADAQVAAERERIAAAIEAMRTYDEDDDRHTSDHAAHVARNAP
jgi:hypothetical protein